MAQTASDVLVAKLIDWGVNTVFGMPGDGINGLMEAFRKRKDTIRFVQVRHEEAAAFAACGYAKFTGRLGVCLATSGPGGIHLLNGLYDAKLDGQPVLALTGMHFHDLLGTHSQQDVELDKLFMDVAVYNTRVMGPAHIGPITDLACRKALGYRGVAHLAVPVDIQDMEVGADQSERNVFGHSSDVLARGARMPDTGDLRRAAEVLNAGKRVTILAGRGALGAASELEATADVLGAPIAKALLGKAAVPDSRPFSTGTIGLLGTQPSNEAMKKCDTLLMVGTSFPYMEFLPEPGKARAVQVDIDPGRIGLRYPVEIGLVGDCKRTLDELQPLLKRNSNREFLSRAQEGMAAWWKLMEKRGTVADKPMKPQVVAWELGRRLADDAVIAVDSGTVTTWWARQIPVKAGQKHSVSGTLASMGCGLPYAIAAQVAHPERQCIALLGDGGFSQLMAEMVTCVKYELPVKIVVIKNNTLGQIKWEQMVFLGNPEYGCELQPIDFAAFARSCGAAGFSVDDPARCGDVLDEFLASSRPAVLEAVVDPHEPPMPAEITFDQAVKFAKSVARGTPDRESVVSTIVKNKVRELV